MNVITVSISELVVDPALSVRQGIDQDTVDRYAEILDRLPPVKVCRLPDGTLLLYDGMHRIEAARRCGVETVDAEVTDGTREWAEEQAILANIAHGKPYTRAERREAIRRMLMMHPDRSDAWIARDLGVSSNTVRRVREEMEATSQIARLERLVGADGKERPRNIERGNDVAAVTPQDGDDGRGLTAEVSPPPVLGAPSTTEDGGNGRGSAAADVVDIPDTPAVRPLPLLVQGNAIRLPLRDGSVHAIVFSPPYWALRLYHGDEQTVVWPGVTYAMPGGEVVIPGDPTCKHEWVTQEMGMRRGKVGDRSTIDGGMRGMMASRLVAVGHEHRNGLSGGIGEGRFRANLRDTEVVGQTVQAAVCRRCGAWRGPLGLEPTPEMYVGHIILILREVRRVLRDDGTLWLNLGFTYFGSWGNYGAREGRQRPAFSEHWTRRAYEGDDGFSDRPPSSLTHPVFKKKDLVPIPWLVAIAAIYDGWFFRTPVVWSKPNPMPSSAGDRLTIDYEHILVLSKSPDYYFDMHGVMERAVTHRPPGCGRRFRRTTWDPVTEAARLAIDLHRAGHPLEEALRFAMGLPTGQAVTEHPSLWRIPVQPYHGAHFATYPPSLVARAIQAATPPVVCARCGRPWRRVVSINRPRLDQEHVDKNTIVRQEMGRRTYRAGHTMRQEWIQTETTYLGWRPDCECFDHLPSLDGDGSDPHPLCTVCGERHTAPAKVLDVTVGSGTTVQVARHLGRLGIGIDVHYGYLHDQAARRAATPPRRVPPVVDAPPLIRRRELPECTYIVGKAEDVLPGLPQGEVDLLFLDPPFNLGKRYGEMVTDSLDDAYYGMMLRTWLDVSLPRVSPSGHVVVHHIPDWAVLIAGYLGEMGWRLIRWVAWRATSTRVGREIPFVPQHYPFLWFTRSREVGVNPVLRPRLRCAHCGEFVDDWGGKEKYYNPMGVKMGDVWVLPLRVKGGRKTRSANELPLEVVLRWVLMLTARGDYVLDPFLGSGTTAAACELSGRRWGGVELNGDNAPVIQVKTMVAKGAGEVINVEGMSAEDRLNLTLDLERAFGDAVRSGERDPSRLLEIGREIGARYIAGTRKEQ